MWKLKNHFNQKKINQYGIWRDDKLNFLTEQTSKFIVDFFMGNAGLFEREKELIF